MSAIYYLWMITLMFLSGWFPAWFGQTFFHEAWGIALVIALPPILGITLAFTFTALSSTLLHTAAAPGFVMLTILWVLRHHLDHKLMFAHPATAALFAVLGITILLLVDTLLKVSQWSSALPDYSWPSLVWIVVAVPFWCKLLQTQTHEY